MNVRIGIGAAVLLLAAGGCVYDGGAETAGASGFCYRNLMLSPNDSDYNLDDGGGIEIAGIVQHAEMFAMEYSIGYQSYEDEDYNGTELLTGVARLTCLASLRPQKNLYLCAGGGITSMVPQSSQFAQPVLTYLGSSFLNDSMCVSCAICARTATGRIGLPFRRMPSWALR